MFDVLLLERMPSLELEPLNPRRVLLRVDMGSTRARSACVFVVSTRSQPHHP